MQFRRQTSRDGRNATANGPAIARLNTGYALKVALVYQDALTQQWAGQVRDHMAGVVGQAAIHCTEWKISDLGERRAYLEGAAALRRPMSLWFHCMRQSGCRPYFTCGLTFGCNSVRSCPERWSPWWSRSKN